MFGGSKDSLVRRTGGVETFLRSLLVFGNNDNTLSLAIGKKNYVFPNIITKWQIANKNKSGPPKQAIRFPYLVYLLCNLAFSLISLFTVFLLANKLRKRFNVVIHVHDSTIGALLFCILSKLLPSIAFISQFHSEYVVRLKTILPASRLSKLTIYLYSLFERMCVLGSDVVIAVSDSINKYLVCLGCKPNKIKKLPIFLTSNHLSKGISKKEEFFKNHKTDGNNIIFIYIGRLSREKNVATLISAFSQLYKCSNQNLLLLIAGEGKQFHKSATCKRVLFLGHRTDVIDLLHLSDIFILPSLTEGFPFSLLEAMAAGKAIIASNIPAIREVVEDRKEALLFDPHNTDQLKDIMLELCSNPKLREKLGKNAKKKAKQYDVDKVFPKIIEVYQQTLRNKITRTFRSS